MVYYFFSLTSILCQFYSLTSIKSEREHSIKKSIMDNRAYNNKVYSLARRKSSNYEKHQEKNTDINTDCQV